MQEQFLHFPVVFEDESVARLHASFQGTGAGHIKTGSRCRREWVTKSHQFLRIEERLKSQANIAGSAAFWEASPD